MTDAPARSPDQQRRAAMRTALLLAAFAATVFATFLWTAMRQ